MSNPLPNYLSTEVPPRPARDIIGAGDCTPACLLALEPDGDCTCRCQGDYHGAMTDTDAEPVATPLPSTRKAPKDVPPIDCDRCGRRIKANPIYIKELMQIWHTDCFSPNGSSRGVHAEAFPHCPSTWHDMYDHPNVMCDVPFAAILRGDWHPPGRYLDEWTPAGAFKAWDMPDQCHDHCKDESAVYYPHRWVNGRAHYECRRGHTWTCWWAGAGTGTSPFRGLPIGAVIPDTPTR